MTESMLQPHECEECDVKLGSDELAYDMRDLRHGGSLRCCRRCYQTSTARASWWELHLVNSAGEVLVSDHPSNTREAIVVKNLLLAYERVFRGGYENDKNLRRFYYRELPKVSVKMVPRMIELLKDLFANLRPLDPSPARIFRETIYRKLRALGLDELCSWGPSLDGEGTLDIDWWLLKTPKDCAILYVVLEDIEIEHGRAIPGRLIMWNLFPRLTDEQISALEIERHHIILVRQTEKLRREEERYAVGHDVTTFNRTFVDLLLKNLHQLLKVGYFHGNMHSCKECKSQKGECGDCYSRDTKFDMTNDDTLGKVWQQTVEALGGKKSAPPDNDSDGEEDDELV